MEIQPYLPPTTEKLDFDYTLNLTAHSKIDNSFTFYDVRNVNIIEPYRVENINKEIVEKANRILKSAEKEYTEEAILMEEKKLYEQNKGIYLTDYEGKYIALRNGKVIEQGSTFSDLAKKVYAKEGYKAIFMTLVERKDRTYKMATPKFK